MGIYISNMEMPDGCYNCGFSYFDKGETNGGELCTVLMCSIINQGTKGADYNGYRPSWCPLVPLPEKHGRLIDADELMEYIKNHEYELKSRMGCVGKGMFTYQIQDYANNHTIIPAEGGGEDG